MSAKGSCTVERSRSVPVPSGRQGEWLMSGSDRAVSVRTIHAGHQHMTWDNAREPAAFSSIARVPLKPFCGTIGLARTEPSGAE